MQIDSHFEFLIKLVLIGDSGVGKTNFILQFTEGRTNNKYVSTVGFDFRSKIIQLEKSKKKIKLQIWDTAGQERYMAINKNLFQKVEGIILMYDITNSSSFQNINKWLNMVKESVYNKTIILVGNKLDLSKEKRIVLESEGEKLAKENRIFFCEGSGFTGENVDKIFNYIAEKIYYRLLDDKSENLSCSLNLKKKFNKEKRGCC